MVERRATSVFAAKIEEDGLRIWQAVGRSCANSGEDLVQGHHSS